MFEHPFESVIEKPVEDKVVEKLDEREPKVILLAVEALYVVRLEEFERHVFDTQRLDDPAVFGRKWGVCKYRFGVEIRPHLQVVNVTANLHVQSCSTKTKAEIVVFAPYSQQNLESDLPQTLSFHYFKPVADDSR